MTHIEQEYDIIMNRPHTIQKYGNILEKKEKEFSSIRPIVLITNERGERLVVKSDFAIPPNNKDEEHFDTIVHEGFIGLYGLNHINNPHFVRTIDAFVNQDCLRKGSGKCSYVVTEYVPGKTLTELLDEITLEDYKYIMMQIFLALFDANYQLAFTHFDLHTNNIIVNKVKGQWFPVIIDYDRAHITLEDTNYGRIFTPSFIINEEFWAYDVFRLLSVIYDKTDYSVAQASIKKWLDFDLENSKLDVSLYHDLDEYIRDLMYRLGLSSTNGTEDKTLLMKKLENEYHRREKELILAQYQEKLGKIQDQREIKDPIAAITEKLLKFFKLEFNSEFHLQYRRKYDHFQLEPTPENKSLSFADFIEYAHAVFEL